MLYDLKWDEKAVEEIPMLDAPSLRGLIYVLRNKKVWPKGFNWNYGDCFSCAMGLAYNMWQNMPFPSSFYIDDYGKKFNLNHYQTRKAFLGGMNKGRLDTSWAPLNARGIPDLTLVTPEMVADILEGYLNGN